MNDDRALLLPGEAALTRFTTEELRSELAAALTVTARHLTHLAAIWQELERRGEDLSGLRSGLFQYMPLIARGQIRPELVVRYAGYLTLLKRVADLPLAVQDDLIADDRVWVAEVQGDTITERAMPLMRLKAQQVVQVLTDRIVPVDVQRAALARVDHRRDARGRRTPPSPIERAVAAESLRSRRDPGRQKVPVTLALSHSEAAALDEHCARLRISRARLLIGLLESAGLLDSTP